VPGYGAPTTGGTCADLDECALGTCGTGSTGCVNMPGSFACSCAPGYTAAVSGAVCADINECATGTPCGALGTGCTNTAGTYACACTAGYAAPASGGTCTDVNECGAGTDDCDRDPAAVCTNTAGSYACTCGAGYAAPASGGECTDINECAAGTDDCDRDPAGCTNTLSSFTCMCPASFTGSGRGASGCLLTDPSLLSLVPSVGALSPAFAGATTLYTLALPPGPTSVTLTPTLIFPTRATVLVNGIPVVSGAASAAVTLTAGFAPTQVTVVVTTETGVTATYTVVLGRSATYVKASNTGAIDWFGWSVALSADGSTLAVGARNETSRATGIGGNQADNSASAAGAVYVY